MSVEETNELRKTFDRLLEQLIDLCPNSNLSQFTSIFSYSTEPCSSVVKA